MNRSIISGTGKGYLKGDRSMLRGLDVSLSAKKRDSAGSYKKRDSAGSYKKRNSAESGRKRNSAESGKKQDLSTLLKAAE